MPKLPVKPGSRRDAVRMVLFTAGLVTLLAGAATAGLYQKQLRGLYYGVRLVWSSDEAWAEKLWKLDEAGAPGCRMAYAISSNVYTQRIAAQALAYCAGMKVLYAFVKEEGIDTPAEKALVDCMWSGVQSWKRPLEGIELSEGELPVGKRPLRRDIFEVREEEKNAKVSLRYTLGEYQAEVRRFVRPLSPVRSCSVAMEQCTSVTVTRSEPGGGRTIVDKVTFPGDW